MRLFGEFPDVVNDGDGSELSIDQPVAAVMEAFEASVVFDLAEDSLWLHGAFALMS